VVGHLTDGPDRGERSFRYYRDADGPETEGAPHLAGLCTGLDRIRRDEGRHVGFVMAKLKALVRDGEVSAASLHETVGDLVPLVTGTTTDRFDDVDADDAVGPGPADLVEYATGKHTQRTRQITSASADIPDVETLTNLEGD
jgi:ribonucleoside-diphosphate reductase beta chain